MTPNHMEVSSEMTQLSTALFEITVIVTYPRQI